nr:right-handed parallel beta-helix repeat-containing protein [Micromonospora tarapacensis]
MQPLAIFDRCEFQGSGETGIAVSGHYLWLVECDIQGMASASPDSGAIDAWQGAAYSVAIRSNLVAGNNIHNVDPHSDGIQSLDTGRTTLHQCWISAGRGPGASQAVRFGTEQGPTTDVQIHHCTIDGGGWAMQMRGELGGGAGIAGVSVVGCRWTGTHEYGPCDFVQTEVIEWSDNQYTDGTPILNPAP